MSIDIKERENILKWDGSKTGFYEVYYMKFNDAASNTAYWIRYTLTSPRPNVCDPYCEIWGIFFDIGDPSKNFAVKNRFPIDKLKWEKDRHHITINDAELTQNAATGRGTHEKDGHTLEWNLTFDSDGDVAYFFPDQSYYEGGFPKTKALVPHQNAKFSGTIVANGRTIKITDAPGQQTHLWGVQHALRWAWGHCNTFTEDPDTIWEGFHGRIKLGPITSPAFKMFYLKTDGKVHQFNKLSQWITNKSNYKLGHWTFACKNDEIRMQGEIISRMEDFVAVTYMDPDGTNLWCNNSKVSKMKLIIMKPNGSVIKELTSEKGAAAEYVDRKIYPEVPVRI